MTLISVGGAVMNGKYPIVAFGGVSTYSYWNFLQDGIDCADGKQLIML